MWTYNLQSLFAVQAWLFYLLTLSTKVFIAASLHRVSCLRESPKRSRAGHVRVKIEKEFKEAVFFVKSRGSGCSCLRCSQVGVFLEDSDSMLIKSFMFYSSLTLWTVCCCVLPGIKNLPRPRHHIHRECERDKARQNLPELERDEPTEARAHRCRRAQLL